MEDRNEEVDRKTASVNDEADDGFRSKSSSDNQLIELFSGSGTGRPSPICDRAIDSWNVASKSADRSKTVAELSDRYIADSGSDVVALLRTQKTRHARGGRLGYFGNKAKGRFNYNDCTGVRRKRVPDIGSTIKTQSKLGFYKFLVKNKLRDKRMASRGKGFDSPRMETGDLAASSFGIGTGYGWKHPNMEYSDMNLREFLDSRQKRNKSELLHVFKQVVVMVDSFHYKGNGLSNFCPSFIRLSPFSNLVEHVDPSAKQESIKSTSDCSENLVSVKPLHEPTSSLSLCISPKKRKIEETTTDTKASSSSISSPECNDSEREERSIFFDAKPQSGIQQPLRASSVESEEKWYTCPEESNGGSDSSISANIYCLGVLLFELLNCFDSEEARNIALSKLTHRILPPQFLSQNPREASLCLWLLHPEPSSRPTTREILQCEVIRELQDVPLNASSSSLAEDYTKSEHLLEFLLSAKEHKQKHMSMLMGELGSLESDIKMITKMVPPETCLPLPLPDVADVRISRNSNQLENLYFSTKSDPHDPIRQDLDLLNLKEVQKPKHGCEIEGMDDRFGVFFDGFCKFIRYSKVTVRGLVRNRDFGTSPNVISSLCFNRDLDYFAAAGASKKIKIFDYNAVVMDHVDNHFPVLEMPYRSKLSCVCWNSYVRNYLVSASYDGVVALWDVNTGKEFQQFKEHEKRAWSVAFSQLSPTKIASGSDDCSVKLWSIHESNSIGTIKSMANVCCVQFSSDSTHLLAFGSADYKAYCYDTRNLRAPWCTLASHSRAVSYVKFLDPQTLVTASTDSSLKAWDLTKTCPVGVSSNCSLTFTGHKNEKNFVGLSAADGYLACGSETNEVYLYYKSLPVPFLSHELGSWDPVSRNEADHGSEFVSSVCWRGKSDILVAANSAGCIKILQLM